MVDRHIRSHRRRGNQRCLKANCNKYEKRNGHAKLHGPMSPIVSAREHSVIRPTPNTERVGAFSDGVFAVIITIMVLELKPPEHPSFAALALLWRLRTDLLRLVRIPSPGSSQCACRGHAMLETRLRRPTLSSNSRTKRGEIGDADLKHAFG